MPQIKTQRQSRTVYEWSDRWGNLYSVASITREEIPLTSKYKRVDCISELEQGDIYYWRGLNGRLSHSCMFDPENELCENYLVIVRKQIARGFIYIRKKEQKRKPKRGEVIGVEKLF